MNFSLLILKSLSTETTCLSVGNIPKTDNKNANTMCFYEGLIKAKGFIAAMFFYVEISQLTFAAASSMISSSSASGSSRMISELKNKRKCRKNLVTYILNKF